MIFIYSSIQKFIWKQHNYQLPVGLLAHLLEHCTDIAEVMGSNPVHARVFFRPYFHCCLSSVNYCEDCFHISLFCTRGLSWFKYDCKGSISDHMAKHRSKYSLPGIQLNTTETVVLFVLQKNSAGERYCYCTGLKKELYTLFNYI